MVGLVGSFTSKICKPVSYTHLDVYKRQGHTMTDTLDALQSSREMRSAKPVSYTHLDVYKRQLYRLIAVFRRYERGIGWNDSGGRDLCLSQFAVGCAVSRARSALALGSYHCLLYTSRGV